VDWLIPGDREELVQVLRGPPRPDRPLLATGAPAPPPEIRTAPDLPPVDVVSTSAMAGILELRARDLTVTVGAGTRVDDLLGELRDEGTWIPLPDATPAPSVGGLLAGAWPGAFDESHGDVRRQVLACEMVTWDGRPARWGRGVMKNVAGYGLTRAVAGALGRLGVVHRVTLRLWPAPEMDRTAALTAEEDADALELAGRATSGDLDARVRPDALTWRGRPGAPPDGGSLEVRLVGAADSVELRLEKLRGWASGHGARVGDAAATPARPSGEGDARPLDVAVAWVAPGRRGFVPTSRALLAAVGDRLVAARGFPLAGRLRLAWSQGDGTEGVEELLRSAGDAPVTLQRGSAEALEAAADRREPAATRLEDRVVDALGGRPRHWLSGYL
jgi:FAD/FMN-containing dehydrogenase